MLIHTHTCGNKFKNIIPPNRKSVWQPKTRTLVCLLTKCTMGAMKLKYNSYGVEKNNTFARNGKMFGFLFSV